MLIDRFSIRVLLGVVGFAAIALGAFVSPWLWSGIYISLCLLIHLIAILAAIYGHGLQRSFWIGFLVLGWPHLIAAMLHEELRLEIQEWMLPDSLLADLNDQFSLGLTYTSVLTVRFTWAVLMGVVGGYVARFFYLSSHAGGDGNNSSLE